MSEYYINPSKTYIFPSEISIVYFEEKILIIAPEHPNWIVLMSNEQLEIFKHFQDGLSIEQVCLMNYSQPDVVYVVTQVEARKFNCCEKLASKKNEIKKDVDMHFYLTNECNLLCSHCYMFSGEKKKDELTGSEIKKVISDFKEKAQGNLITFSGGEPSLRKDFDEIICYASECGLEVKLLTNGTLFTQERVSKISKYLSSVQISIDGFSEETNALIRGRANFEKALKSVEAFLDNGVRTAIAITPSIISLRKNQHDYIQFAKKLSTKYKKRPFEIRFSEELLNGRFLQNAREVNEEYGQLIHSVQEKLFGSSYALMEFVKKLTDNPKIANCSFGSMTVSASGDVYTCPRIGDIKSIGNVRTSSFEEIWNKLNYIEQITEVSQIEPCYSCNLRYICGGGCRLKEIPQGILDNVIEMKVTKRIRRRECDERQKHKFYRFMIESNEYFYSELDKNSPNCKQIS